MTFLKKLGEILLKGTALAMGVAPMFPKYEEAIEKGVDTIRKIMGIVVAVEVIGQKLQLPGPQKLTAAAPLIAQVILESDMMIGRKIDNPVLFQEGATAIADGMAKILNSLKDDIDTESKV